MSQENVDRFTHAIEIFNRFTENPAPLDAGALRDFLAAMDQQIEFEPQQAALEGSYTGHDGVMQWLTDLAGIYESGQLHFTETRDLEDRVLAVGTLHFTGRGSGIVTEAPSAVVATFRDGLITAFKDYGAMQPALAAVGLSE